MAQRCSKVLHLCHGLGRNTTCRRNGVVMREGKPFCRQHDPVEAAKVAKAALADQLADAVRGHWRGEPLARAEEQARPLKGWRTILVNGGGIMRIIEREVPAKKGKKHGHDPVEDELRNLAPMEWLRKLAESEKAAKDATAALRLAEKVIFDMLLCPSCPTCPTCQKARAYCAKRGLGV